MHAAHPSVRVDVDEGLESGRYAHFSEWALSGMVFPESEVRSTLGKGKGGGEGKVKEEVPREDR